MKNYYTLEPDKFYPLRKHYTVGRGGAKIEFITRHHLMYIGEVEASPTHGFGNGLSRWPGEMPTLLDLGAANLSAIEETIERHGIDCDFQRTGALAIATREHEVEGLREEHLRMRRLGHDNAWLDRDEIRARLDSPTFLAAYHDPEAAVVEPAWLAWGLREACRREGVAVHEDTRVTAVEREGSGVRLRTLSGGHEGTVTLWTIAG